MASAPFSTDYISQVRRVRLFAPAEDFHRVPEELVDEAVARFGDVLVLSRAWRPPEPATYEMAVGPTLLRLRVRYASPGGPLELRSEGTAVLHVLERPEPVTPALAVQLAHAMFGESNAATDRDPFRWVWSELYFQPVDGEGVRFLTKLEPKEPEFPAAENRTGFFGGLIADRRIEFVSLYNDPRNNSSSVGGPRQWSAPWIDLEPWKAAYAAAKRE